MPPQTKNRRCQVLKMNGDLDFMATFHAFSTDFAEFESGPGHYPVAVVEDDSGRCHSVYVKYIHFGLTEETETNDTQ